MTAVAGIWRLDGRPDAAEACDRMLRPLRMYGPDATAAWSDGDVAMGRCLKRILPEDDYDRQPLAGERGLALVADARVDNRDELARDLGIRSLQLDETSDADLMLKAYERWQTDAFDRILGNFACAVWDGARRQLILAKDAIGMRPLYYHRGPGLIAFATMPKGLHALPEVPYTPDEEKIAEFLMLTPDWGAETFFRGVEKVGAGTFVTIGQDGGVAIHRHWTPSRRKIRLKSADDYAEALREQLDGAVARCLRGEREVAAHLSAGYDSSSVAATAARLLAPSGGRVHAFTSVPREGYRDTARRPRLIDEGPLAAATAAIYPNMEHVLIRPAGRSPLQGLDRNFQLFERPLLNLCNQVWGDAINDAVRDRKLGVLLTGSMGNMTLSYNGAELLPELIRAGRLIRWLREAGGLHKSQQVRWVSVMARSLGPWFPVWLWKLARRINGASAFDLASYTLIRPSRVDELGLEAKAKARGQDLAYRPWKDGFEARTWVMRRGDRGAGQKGLLAGWGIDLRDPTADRRLVEFCLSVPTGEFMRDGVPRALARRALADRLPAAVLDAPLKGTQAADWHEGLTAARDEIAAEVERLAASAPASAALSTERMRQLVRDWPQSGWDRHEVIEPYRLA
ncbi:MAG TPA: asparagine synthase-related protein, partial [Caulobacteraceae bacterium]|nr:asparagine synthase-related protein [Caulobacteraceae bacterium]